MTLKHRIIGMPLPLYNAEGAGSGSGDGGSGSGDGAATGAGAGDQTKTPENVLFGNESGEKKSDAPAAGGEGKKTEGDGAGEWKEYVPDPNKSDEENARLKAEHDKTKPGEKKDDPADKVPEDGKYDLKMPDGVELDTELAEALGPEFKEFGLTNKQAQRLVDKYIEIQTKRGEERVKSWGETVQKWADDAKADKEIGGDKWDASVNNARRFIDTMGTPALKEFLNASGGGNHPELIRIFAKAGALIKEDDPALGGAEARGKPADAATILFPTDAPKG